MSALPERLVRRRRDGILQIRRRGLLDRASRLTRDLGLALAVVVLGTLAYTAVRAFVVSLVALLALWGGRALWRLRHRGGEVMGRGQVQVIRLEGRRLRR